MDKQGQIKARSISVDEIQVSRNSAGEAKIKAYQTTVTVFNTLIQPDSIILLTPQIPLAQTMAVTAKTPGTSFTVKIAYPENTDINFTYLIVGLNN